MNSENTFVSDTKFLQLLSNEFSTVKREELIHQYVDIHNDEIELDELKLTSEQVENEFFEYLLLQVRQRIASYSTDQNPVRRGTKRNELIQWLREFINDTKEIEKIILKCSQEIKEIKLYKTGELFDLLKDREVDYIIQDLLFPGRLLLVVGPPKSFKSLFVTSLAVSVSLGRQFLGRLTTQCNVLYAQNEEKLTDTASRIYTNGLQLLQIQDPELYEELTSSHRLVVSSDLKLTDRDSLVKIIKEHDIRVVIMDSLRASIGTLTELSPELIGELYAFQKVLQETNCVGLIIHHSTKMKQEDTKLGAIHGIGGHNGIAGANDGFFFLKPSKVTDSVDLTVIPREGGAQEFLLTRFEDEARFWNFRVAKESRTTAEGLETQYQILSLLYEAKNIGEESEDELLLSADELSKSLGSTSKEIIPHLNRLLEMFLIEVVGKEKKFVYKISEDGTTYYELQEAQRAETEAAEARKRQYQLDMAMAMSACNSVDEWQALTKGWSKTEKAEILALLSEAEQQGVLLMLRPPKFQIGQTVYIEDIETQVVGVKFDINKKHHLYYIPDISEPYLEEQLQA
jgi:hypothetical protein